MKDFIDQTLTQEGTPINRANLMALQGFISSTITLNADGTITETNDNGEELTVDFSENAVTETFVGEKTITRQTTIQKNGISIVVR